MTLQDKMNKSYKPALDSLKTEIASELGLSNYDSIDKGNLTARQNGYVGGYMTKTLVDMAEKSLSGNMSSMSGNMSSMSGNMSSMSGK
ncbi:small, acid-soluble spore protein, alpha/beta type [Aminipila terrae]|uniref:Small, acid-soluble spore protein, alpha/beta type n=1 Tax=Aminipila terrae TaxID=2697030 RepID=A0A6P1MHR0_9FIRM|nr:small, acid-soluble spore protein, alpha/beta type [Aminipila terrae]